MKKYIFLLFLLGAMLFQNVSASVDYPLKEIKMEKEDKFISPSDKIDPDKPMVAITFDDGPTRAITTQILDCLKENNAYATFFVLGSRIEDAKDILERMILDGHEIGNHSFTHKQLNAISRESVVDEIAKANDAIYDAIHEYPMIIRLPYGESSTQVQELCGDMNIIKWTIDSEDWRSKNSDTIVNKVMAEVQDGSIILLHDLYTSTADAACILIPKLIEEGYQLVTVSQLLSFDNE